MATLKAVKNSIKTLVEGIQLNINGLGDAFANVYDYPQESFEGYPNAVITLDSSESQSQTNVTNERTDVFIVYIILPIEDDGLTSSEVFDRVYDLIDQVRNGLDQSIDLSGTVLYLNPATGGISLQETAGGMSVVGEVRVEVRHTYDFVT